MPKTEDMIVQALSNFEKKLDSLDTRLDSVDRTLVKQEANLGEHMRRTELAEKNIENVQKDSDKKIESVKKDLEPVKRHVAYMEGALKALGILAIIVTIAGGIYSMLQ